MLTVVPEHLNGRAYTIFGGSSEIQRDIMARWSWGLIRRSWASKSIDPITSS